MVFLQSYLMLNRSNEIVFLAVNEQGSSMIYPTVQMVRESGSFFGRGGVGKAFSRCVEEGMSRMAKYRNKVKAIGRSTISNALGTGLCYANRVQKEMAGKLLQVWDVAKICTVFFSGLLGCRGINVKLIFAPPFLVRALPPPHPRQKDTGFSHEG